MSRAAMLSRLSLPAVVAVLTVGAAPPTAVGAAGPAAAQDGAEALYVCDGEARVEAAAVGLVLCDGAPTPALNDRAEPENLQIREGALVADVAAEGVAGAAGVQAGDLIYRVGGGDVPDAAAAAERLGLVAARADTLVNFLRGGRPYLVKLRRD